MVENNRNYDVPHVSPKVKEWFENLREEDVKDWQDALEFRRQLSTVARFNKWLIITIFGIVIAVSQLGDVFMRVLGWLRSGVK